MPWTERRNLAATKLPPNNDEASTDRASNTTRGSSGSGVQRRDVASSVVTRPADVKLLEVLDVDLNAEDSCEVQVKLAKTVMGLDCVRTIVAKIITDLTRYRPIVLELI